MIEKIKVRLNIYRLNLVTLLRKIQLRLTSDQSKINHLKATYKSGRSWYGSSYGGFYINPLLLNEHSIVYSFGIGKDITFDRKIIDKHGCKVYAFDPTPKSIEYIKSQNISKLFNFSPVGISTVTGKEFFYLPKNKKAVSGSMAKNDFVDDTNSIEVQMKSFQDIVDELGHKQIDVLKMDIEGSEYDVIPTIINSGVLIKQLLIEFHDRFFETDVYKSKHIVELLKSNGFQIFAVSMSYEEVSFVNINMLSSKTQI